MPRLLRDVTGVRGDKIETKPDETMTEMPMDVLTSVSGLDLMRETQNQQA